MNILNELEKLGVEITEDISKKFKGDFISEQESSKKMSKLESELENWKAKAETAETTLKGFEGKDFDAITKERDEWKVKAENAEKEYSKKEAERLKADLIKEAMADIKFTSESARKAITAQITEGVTVKDGKLIGLNDLIAVARESDAGAFVDEQKEALEKSKASFTKSMSNSNSSNNDKVTKESILSIKDRAERQKAIAENIALFQ